LYFKIFLSSAVKFQCPKKPFKGKVLETSEWLTLVRLPLIFELLLVRFPLHLELFLEFGVGFLETAALRLFIGDAFFQGGELLVTTHNGFQLF
jgi:hypothetical protein